MFLDMVGAITSCVYFFSCGFLRHHTVMRKRPISAARRANTIWRWTKWPSLVHIIANIPLNIYCYGHRPDIWDWFFLTINLMLWYSYRNMGDDDPMDKLKDKITEKVKEINGRLVLVPAEA